MMMTSRISIVWALWLFCCPLGNSQASEVLQRCYDDNREDWTQTSDPGYPAGGFPYANAVEDCRTACRRTDKTIIAVVRRRLQGNTQLSHAHCYCLEDWPAGQVSETSCDFDCGGIVCGGRTSFSGYSTCPTLTYGNDCQHTCPENCNYLICQVGNGNCRGGCKGAGQLNCLNDVCDALTGECTEGCDPGWYTDSCKTECPSNCANNMCNQVTGVCNGCKTTEEGWYTDTCNTPCPTNCANNMCDQTSGSCSDGCDPGWYGDTCSIRCPPNCADDRCGQTTGECTEGCKTAEEGWYGSTCATPCPINCRGNTCDTQTGTCNGCEDGFHGTTCENICSEGCAQTRCLQSDGSCEGGCKDRNYTATCDMTCPVNCNCNPLNGSCNGCKAGWFGQMCNQACFVDCDGSCNQDTGFCSKCKDGFYGDNCNETCPSNCLEEHCNFLSGTCDRGCQHGYYGESFCEKPCPVNCQNGVCDIDDGTCIRGCVTGWEGETCETAVQGQPAPTPDNSQGPANPESGGVELVLIFAVVVSVMATILLGMAGVIVWLCRSRKELKNSLARHQTGGQTTQNLDYVNTQSFVPDEARPEVLATGATVTQENKESQMYEMMGEMDEKVNTVYDQINIEV